jgi:carboxylesterase
MTTAVMVGCEPMSHAAGSPVGVLALHGFTGSPASMRQIADAACERGFDVELPRLPGHGTTLDEMLTTSWADWATEVERAYVALADRTDRVVVTGLSMGGTLTLWLALRYPALAGIVCINPATQLRDDTPVAMIDEYVEDGFVILPGGGNDIADPDAVDIGYDGTPLPCLRSLIVDGIAPITGRFAELTMPLRLMTSRHDHVVPIADSEHLAATYGGPVEHTWLERSYHVATRDHDRDLVAAAAVDFVERVAGS